MAQFEELLQEPRKLVPYTDAEIREIFLRAKREEEQVADVLPNEEEEESLEDALGLDFIANGVGGMLLGASMGAIGDSFLLGGVAGLIISAAITLGCGAAGIDAGGFTRAVRRRQAQTPVVQTWRGSKIDVESPDVLRTVMTFMSREPLAQSRLLLGEIAAKRAEVADSIHDLGEVLTSLEKELAACDSDDLRLLLVSQQDAAQMYRGQLEAVDSTLAAQADEARAAVAPVTEILEKITRIGRITDTLARVRAAHEMVDSGHEAIAMNRLELSLLSSVSAAAMARLRDLESLVMATKAARTEIDASSRL